MLKPTGSLFINIGDKHATRWSSHSEGGGLHSGRGRDFRQRRNVSGVAEKSLIGIPWRYAIACMDEFGLALRAAIVWHKPNAMPESVRDRVVTSHELILHFTMQQHYYQATDEIREPHEGRPQRRPNGHRERPQLGVLPPQTWSTSARDEPGPDGHPLGKLPRSVWPIPTVPLRLPPGVDGEHYAAWPPAVPSRIIRGWSPAKVCTACGEGRFPVTSYTGEKGRHPGGGGTYRAMRHPGHMNTNLADAAMRVRGIIGYACTCTPFTRRPEGGREYHFDQWTPAPATPGVVLDPFAGTGTTLMVADLLGRRGIGTELSRRYLRLAEWRVNDPGERAAALGKPRPAPVPPGQLSLEDLVMEEGA